MAKYAATCWPSWMWTIKRCVLYFNVFDITGISNSTNFENKWFLVYMHIPKESLQKCESWFLFGPLASSASLFFQTSKPTWLGGVEGAKKSTSTTLCWSGWNGWVLSKWFPMSEIFGWHSTRCSVWALRFKRTFDVYLCRFGICFSKPLTSQQEIWNQFESVPNSSPPSETLSVHSLWPIPAYPAVKYQTTPWLPKKHPWVKRLI